MRIKKTTSAGILLFACVFLLNACVSVRHNPNIQSPDRTQTPPASSAHYWYYYPDIRVYYHVTQRYYYYPVGGHWRKAKQLPPGWVINRKGRVRLKIVGKPYSKHAYHQHKYPPKHMTGNIPGKQTPGGKKDKQHRNNSKNKNGDPGMHAKKHVPRNRPDHADKRGTEGKHRPPAHAMNNKKLHRGRGNSDDAPGRSHNKANRHAKKPVLHQHKPGNYKKDNGRGKPAAKQARGNGHQMKVSPQVKKDRHNNTVHFKADKSRKVNGKLNKSNTAGKKQVGPEKAAQRPPEQHKPGQSGKNHRKQQDPVKVHGRARTQVKQVTPKGHSAAKAAQRPPKQRESGKSGKTHRKQQDLAEAHGPARAQVKQAPPNGHSAAKTAQPPQQQHKSDHSGKKPRKEQTVAEADQRAQVQIKHASPVSKGRKAKHATVKSND